MFLFDTFQIGDEIGTYGSVVRPEDVDAWVRLYGGEVPSSQGVPWGLVSALCMKAYLSVVTPRPPGNIHAKQSYKVFERPKVLQDITASIKCLNKEKKNDRLMVSFSTTLSSTCGKQSIMIATSTMLWAR